MRVQGNVHGVVLAGVHAWGNFALEHALPRPLIPVAGRPLIHHTLSWLRNAGILSASICANSDTSVLRRCLGNGHALSLSLDYYEDVMPRGPAGCARDSVIYNDCSTFVVMDATIVPRIDLLRLVEAHQESKAALTVVVTSSHSDGVRSCALLAPAGIYVFSPPALESIPADGYQDIKEYLIPRLYAEGKSVLTYFVDPKAVFRVEGVSSYLALSNRLVEKLDQNDLLATEYVRRGQAWIHRSAKIHDAARFVGPSLVGADSVLESGALIVGPSVVGHECVIGAGAVVGRSALWSRCTVGPGATVDYSVMIDSAQVDADQHLHYMVVMPRGRSVGTLWASLLSLLHGTGDRRQAVSPLDDYGYSRTPAEALLAKACQIAGSEWNMSQRPVGGMKLERSSVECRVPGQLN